MFFKNHWLLILIITIIFKIFLMPIYNYKKALALTEAGQYAEAFEIFYNLGDYEDSIKQAEAIKESHGTDLLKLISTGNIVSFGTYEQDNDISNGPEEIEWLVLTRENNRILVISRYILDCNLSDSLYDNINVWGNDTYTWKKNRFRAWLNDIFLKTAFSSSEQLSIPTVKVVDGTNDTGTQDKIFFLSSAEVEQYFIFDADLECKPTKYAKARGCSVDEDDGNCEWWLRSHARGSSSSFVTINHKGAVYLGGKWMSSNFTGIRPALCIDLGS